MKNAEKIFNIGQWIMILGSIAYAKQGYSWDEILLKYYSNCYIAYKY